jgi:hypothetical protein
MCSIITIASSTIKPTAAAIPPNVMMLKLMWSMERNRIVVARTVGTAMMAIKVNLTLRRKTSITTAASPTPMSTASRTLPAEETMISLWSYQLAMRTSGGRRF